MKWLLAMLSKGKDMSEFFADVVKNVIAGHVEVKKMVYMYLVHYAVSQPLYAFVLPFSLLRATGCFWLAGP